MRTVARRHRFASIASISIVACTSATEPAAPTTVEATPSLEASPQVEAAPATPEHTPTPVAAATGSTIAVSPAIAERVPIADDAKPWHEIVAFAADASEGAVVRDHTGKVWAALGPRMMELRDDGTLGTTFTADGIEPPLGGPWKFDGDMVGYRAPRLDAMDASGGYLVLSYTLGARGEPPPTETFRLAQHRWQRVDTHERLFDWHPRAIATWRDGSVLALKGFVPRYAYTLGDAEDEPPTHVAKATARAIARQDRLVLLHGSGRAPTLHTDGEITAFDALPSGELVAIVTKGDTPHTAIHYDDATGTQRSFALPSVERPSLDEPHLEMRTKDDVWMWGGGLLHFDGVAWQRVDVPCTHPPRLFALAGPDTELAACMMEFGDDLQWAILRRRAGTWRSIGLPPALADATIHGVLADDDRVLVVVDFDAKPGWSIWHDGPAVERPHAFDDTVTVAARIDEHAADAPVTDDDAQ